MICPRFIRSVASALAITSAASAFSGAERIATAPAPPARPRASLTLLSPGGRASRSPRIRRRKPRKSTRQTTAGKHGIVDCQRRKERHRPARWPRRARRAPRPSRRTGSRRSIGAPGPRTPPPVTASSSRIRPISCWTRRRARAASTRPSSADARRRLPPGPVHLLRWTGLALPRARRET